MLFLSQFQSHKSHSQSHIKQLQSHITQFQSNITQFRSNMTQFQSCKTQFGFHITQSKQHITQFRSQLCLVRRRRSKKCGWRGSEFLCFDSPQFPTGMSYLKKSYCMTKKISIFSLVQPQTFSKVLIFHFIMQKWSQKYDLTCNFSMYNFAIFVICAQVIQKIQVCYNFLMNFEGF